MSNKFLVYTSNLDIMPKNMADIIQFAKKTPKVYISSVELNSTLRNVKAGDNIITKKGNSIYVLRALTDSLDNLSEEDQAYIDEMESYGLRKVNITSVQTIVRFEEWCKSAKVFNNNTKEKKTMNSIKSYGTRLKEMFLPQEATDCRLATDGSICVATNAGYVSINAANELISYPEELTISGLPIYTMAKPKDQLKKGDIIARDRAYYKVTKIDGDKVTCIGYTGTGKTIHFIKDFLFNQTLVRTVVSLAGNLGGQFNPLYAMMLADKGGFEDNKLAMLMMMNQNGGSVAPNNLLPLLLMSDKGGGSDLKDILMMSAFTGGANPFAAIFGGAAPQTAPVAPAAEAEPEKEG